MSAKSTPSTTPEKYILTITSKDVISTDKNFDINNIALGDKYKPLDVYFEKSNGEIIKRKYNKGEYKISNQTMAKIAFQVFENEIISLNSKEMREFPICQYSPSSSVIRGIFTNPADFKKERNTIEYMTYTYNDGKSKFIIYSWNVFSTILFVKECLKKFGDSGDKFVLTYRKKEGKEIKDTIDFEKEIVEKKELKEYRNPYSQKLIESKNIIFRGAPGTGKTHLAKEIATDIVSNGYFDDYTMLSDEQKKQIEFVQFHPSYDYSDFVEGLRPSLNKVGGVGFELQDGVFKKFVDGARQNYESAQNAEEIKKYIFIIDEINRGEISKIFGELFFTIDPGYRGKQGEVSTQYSNLHTNPNEKFYIPENVYIIGTMNDIDRSVDSFDFAMRRRFRFIEIKAEDTMGMLDLLENEDLKSESIRRMTELNRKIVQVDGLNENYQIGASYFLKVKKLGFHQLWTDHLQPLLQEYVRGMYDEEGLMEGFAKAYGYSEQDESDDEAIQD